MVAVTRSKSKNPEISTNQVKNTTPQKVLAQSPARVEIPKDLYQAIFMAAEIRQALKRNIKDKNLQRQKYTYERKIKVLAMYHKYTHELPSSWEYNHNTSVSTYVPKSPKPPKRKRKTKRNIVGLPTFNGSPSNEAEHKVWIMFEKMNKKTAHPCMSLPMEMIQVALTDPVVNFILDFAVEAVNDAYHKYVKDHRSKNITMAVPVECKYYKLTSIYYFKVTIDAVEQGKHGLYEATVECDRVTGARTLCDFLLITAMSLGSYGLSPQYKGGERSFHQVSGYEEAWSSDSSGPEDFYKISGMVHRRRHTRGCGFDYYNPSSALHRYVLDDGRKPEKYGRGKAARFS